MEWLLFSLILSFLFVHEMDAIRAREWKMFIILKDMPEETAYKIFTVIHLPLYCAILYLLFTGPAASLILKFVIDIFVIGHSIIHFGFKKHENNNFTTRFSKFIIYVMPVLAALHLCLLYI